MPFMQWIDELSTGIAEFDEQHKILIKLINELYDAKEEGTADRVLLEVLAGVVNYTVYHFFAEEHLFELLEYPDAARHKTEHVAMTADALRFFDKVENGDYSIIDDVLGFLKDWLANHIMVSDKQYSLFFMEKGLRAPGAQ